MAARRAISSSAAIVVTLAVALVVSFVVLSGRNQPTAVEGVSWPGLTLGSADRLLILAPHPDDEVLGCGGVIPQAVALGLPVRIVFFPYRDFYE